MKEATNYKTCPSETDEKKIYEDKMSFRVKSKFVQVSG